MYTLNSITIHPVYSANGNLTITKTVINTIAALGRSRPLMSAEDVAYVINRRVYADEQVTAKQVEQVMNEIARAGRRGERYHGMRNLIALGSNFYEYK